MDTSVEELVNAVASLTLERLRLLSEIRRMSAELTKLKENTDLQNGGHDPRWLDTATTDEN